LKTLLVLRHAKSSWKDSELDDHDRPLNKRGEKEAPRVGKHLRKIELVPSAIICSTARRAKETAIAVAENSGFPVEQIVYERRLYHAAPKQMMEVIREFPEQWEQPMIVGHNPGLEEMVCALINDEVELKTAALAVIAFEIDGWRNIALVGRGNLVSVVRGREL
jgi:phosphohistidine phosphatase